MKANEEKESKPILDWTNTKNDLKLLICMAIDKKYDKNSNQVSLNTNLAKWNNLWKAQWHVQLTLITDVPWVTTIYLNIFLKLSSTPNFKCTVEYFKT